MPEMFTAENMTARLSQSVAHLLEHAIAMCLRINPELEQEIESLHSKVIALEITSLNLTLFFVFNAHRVSVKTAYAKEPDTWIRGGLVHLMRVARRDTSSPIQLEISGDVRVGECFQKFLRQVRPEWEELLAQASNDVVASEAGRLVRALQKWGKRAKNAVEYSVSDYLREEVNVLTSREQLDSFIAQVDQLRDQVDRLEARIEQTRLAQTQ